MFSAEPFSPQLTVPASESACPVIVRICQVCFGDHSTEECIAEIAREHMKSEAKTKRKRSGSEDDEPSNITPRKKDDDEDDEDDTQHHQMHSASRAAGKYALSLGSSSTSKGECILDTGCSTTAMKSMDRFTVWKTMEKRINTASDSITINRVGPVGPFRNVYFMPSLYMDLVSVGDLDDLGIAITIKEGIMRLLFNDRVVLSVKKSKNVWIINTDLLMERVTDALELKKSKSFWWMAPNIESEVAKLPETRAVIQAQKLLALFHLRLGHRSERSIIEAVNGNLIHIGKLPVDKLSVEKHCSDRVCTCCATSKSHKLPRKARPTEQRTRRVYTSEPNPNFEEGKDKQQGFVAGQVSTDMCGPYTIPSYKHGYVGNQDFMLMDSKEVYLYGYKRKNESLRNLKDFVEVRLKHKQLALISYHSDGAKELMGRSITDYLGVKGVKNTFTTAYSPQENSYMERHFRTENEGTQSMMCYARFLPKSLWFFAKEAFTYIYNRLPTQTAKGIMSPYQYRTGRVPDLTHLRVWGSKCFTNIDSKLRRKDFAAKAMIGYLVGYSDLQKDAYKIWIPQSGRMIVSRDVKFDENIPQGPIDHTQDIYWREVRQFRTSVADKKPDPEDFYYLIGLVFYDPDIDSECEVARIEVIGRQRLIVAYIKKMRPDGSPEEVEEKQPVHVAEIEALLGTSYEDRDDGEVSAMALSIALGDVCAPMSDVADSTLRPTEEPTKSEATSSSPPRESNRPVLTDASFINAEKCADGGNGLVLPSSGVPNQTQVTIELPYHVGIDYSSVMCYLSENVIDPKD